MRRGLEFGHIGENPDRPSDRLPYPVLMPVQPIFGAFTSGFEQKPGADLDRDISREAAMPWAFGSADDTRID